MGGPGVGMAATAVGTRGDAAQHTAAGRSFEQVRPYQEYESNSGSIVELEPGLEPKNRSPPARRPARTR